MIRRLVSDLVYEAVHKACICCRLQSIAVLAAFDADFTLWSACRAALERRDA